MAQALDRPEAERSAFLRRACGGDEALRREVSELLAAAAAAGTFLEQPLTRLRAAPLGEAASEGERFGPYRLQRILGKGGMGVVYLAVREDGHYRRQVAIKVLRRDLQRPDSVLRFRTERQVLADLEHPSIARLYDGGATDDGRQYLVMEYVEGLPIDLYCDHNRLSVEQRLRLFRRVCAAVHYAHRNLLVHRDLKPANILVKADGVPKLVDFGIAKLLDNTRLEATIQATGTGIRPMTPAWASPEQIRGAAVTTATDVYALGALLYRLLTGHGPYRVDSDLPHAIERAICEQDPERPSQVVARSASETGDGRGADPEGLSRCRATTPRELGRRLSGDLDTIVLKAMRKEPERRYGSVEQLAEDLERYLDDRPVRARPASRRYRWAKFFRRNTAAVLSGSLAAALLLGFSVLTSVQSARVLRERETAQKERQKAQQVSDFLIQLFEESDPNATPGEPLTVREVLDRGAEKIDRFDDQPELQAAYMTVIGRAYRALGLYAAAEPMVADALALRRQVHGEEHLEVAESLNEQAALRYLTGDWQTSEELMAQVLALRRRLLGEAHPDLAASLSNLAVLRHARGDHDSAEELYREALAMRRDLLGDGHREVANTRYELARLLGEKGDYEVALPLLEEAAAVLRELQAVHGDLATVLNELAYLHFVLGDFAAARPLFDEALGMRRQLYGKEHPEVAASLNDLGLLLEAQGDYSAALPLLRQALEVQRRLMGEEHAWVASSKNNLAHVLWRLGDDSVAERLHREALAQRRELLGGDHYHVGVSMGNLGRLLATRGDLAAAEPLLLRGLEIHRRHLGEEHPRLAKALRQVAFLRWRQGDHAAAIELYGETLSRRRERLPATHPDLAIALGELAVAHLLAGALTAAEPLLREAIEIQRHHALTSPEAAANLRALARLRLAQGESGAARPLARQALEILRRRLGEDHWHTAYTRVVLAACSSAAGRGGEAEALVAGAQEILNARLGPDAPETRDSGRLIAELRAGQSRRRVDAAAVAGD